MMRGFRGATTVAGNEKELIYAAVQELVQEILRRNKLETDAIGATIFSSTEDLTSAFPAAGARAIPGFDAVPLFDARQIAVEESLPRCIRVLILAETEMGQREISHVYLHGAANLRPDLCEKKSKNNFQ